MNRPAVRAGVRESDWTNAAAGCEEEAELEERRADLTHAPVLSVCGYSGAGKTTLIEAVLQRLLGRGLAVAVVKHDAHGLDVDRPGKDSDRLFRAGADVVLRGPGEVLERSHGDGELADAVDGLLEDHDLVLVEGHKSTPLPKVWLGDRVPPELENVVEELAPGDEREQRLLALIDRRLEAAHAERPLLAGILVGGGSTRMGQPKQLIEVDGVSLLDRVALALGPSAGRPVLLGEGPVPPGWEEGARLPDPTGVSGPAAGMLAAMRWAPRATWLIASCDLPAVESGAVQWILDQRRPGRWAVLPSVDGTHPEPLLAVYEPQARRLLEAAVRAGRGPSSLARHGSVDVVTVPVPLRACWRDADTPADLPG